MIYETSFLVLEFSVSSTKMYFRLSKFFHSAKNVPQNSMKPAFHNSHCRSSKQRASDPMSTLFTSCLQPLAFKLLLSITQYTQCLQYRVHVYDTFNYHQWIVNIAYIDLAASIYSKEIIANRPPTSACLVYRVTARESPGTFRVWFQVLLVNKRRLHVYT